MAKQERATDKLNVALGVISAASSVGVGFIDQLPDSDQKRALKRLGRQIEEGIWAAHQHLRAIKNAIETI